VLTGGGRPVDEAMQWFIQRSGGGDFLVLRTSGGAEMNPYLMKLGGLDSVESLVVHERVAAADAAVVERIRGAEAIFFADGSQYDTIRYWQQTPIEHQIHLAMVRGVPLGAAGGAFAALGQFSFSAENGQITSEEALQNPYAAKIKLAREFFKLELLESVLGEPQFRQQDRMGRLIVFLARIVQNGWKRSSRGIGIDENTALVVDEDGKARVMGEGSVYFLRTVRKADVCEPSVPLSMRSGVDVYRIDKNGTFDLDGWDGSGGLKYNVIVERGKMQSTQPNGSIY
jgi:cyanophycinase